MSVFGRGSFLIRTLERAFGGSPWLFVLAAAASLAVAALTIGVRALRAAAADPVESLRYE